MAILHELIARVPTISSTSRGPIVNVVGWITMVTMCLAVFTVLISKIFVRRKLGWIDLIIMLAMLFAVAFTITISIQVSHGLGSPLHTITQSDYDTFQKAGYASQILYISALTAAKVSTLTLLLILTPQKFHRVPIFITIGVVAAWSLSSILGSIFQCSLPNAYLYTSGKCFDQNAFWYGVGIVDMLTDLALMVLPVIIVGHLQLPLKKKLAVSFAFSFRTFAIACCILRLVELPTKSFRHGTNVTLDSWMFTVAAGLQVFFSVFATAVPQLRPFMESIQSGYLGGAIHNDGENRSAYGSQVSSGHHGMKETTTRSTPAQIVGLETKHSAISYAGSLRSKSGDEHVEPRRHGQMYVEEKDPACIGRAVSTGEVRMESSDSTGSQKRGSRESVGSKAMIIKTTKEWSISYQE